MEGAVEFWNAMKSLYTDQEELNRMRDARRLPDINLKGLWGTHPHGMANRDQKRRARAEKGHAKKAKTSASWQSWSQKEAAKDKWKGQMIENSSGKVVKMCWEEEEQALAEEQDEEWEEYSQEAWEKASWKNWS